MQERHVAYLLVAMFTRPSSLGGDCSATAVSIHSRELAKSSRSAQPLTPAHTFTTFQCLFTSDSMTSPPTLDGWCGWLLCMAVLQSSFHDERALEMPHKLYMASFSPEYIAAVPASLRTAVEWLEPFVRDYIDLSEWKARKTQFFVQGVRLLQRPRVGKL